MFSRRSLLAGAAAVGGIALTAQIPSSRSNSAPLRMIRGKPGWNQLALGPWGFATGLQFDASGLYAVCSTDVGGAYFAEAPAFRWRQVITPETLAASGCRCFGEDHPIGEGGYSDSAGVHAIAIAPSDGSRLYVTWEGYVLKSVDQGRRWTRTNLPRTKLLANGPESKKYGPKLVVDPINPDVVYLATMAGGIWRTLDGGERWSEVSAVTPKGVQNAWAVVCIDWSSASLQAQGVVRKSRVYFASTGNGFYRSNDGGDSFALIDAGVHSVSQLVIDSSGGVYCCDMGSGYLQRFENERFTRLVIRDLPGIYTVGVDPTDNKRLVAFSGNGFNSLSTDRGASWTYPRNAGVNKKNASSWDLVAEDVPALAQSEDFGLAASAVFRPGVPNELWCPLGIGIARCAYPDGDLSNANRPVFQSVSAGIETLVVRQILSAPGAMPIVGCWDRPLFRIADPDTYPATYGPDPVLRHAASLDFAKDNPSKLAALVFHWGRNPPGWSCYSDDAGTTWTRFEEQPLKVEGASMAMGREGNIVVFPQMNGTPTFTQDNGRTWAEMSFAPLGPAVQGSETGFGFGNNAQNRQIATHDGQSFFVYNYGSSDPAVSKSRVGIWRSETGEKWVRVHAGPIAPYATYHSTLKAAFGRTSHLFLAAGDVGGETNPADTDFMFSDDAGVSWKALRGFKEVKFFDFGKPASQGAYPAIYVLGYYRGRFSAWQCTDFDDMRREGNWTDLGLPNTVGFPTCLCADRNYYGRLFLGYSGFGAFYGNFA